MNVLQFPQQPRKAEASEPVPVPTKSPELALCLAILSTMTYGQHADVRNALRKMAALSSEDDGAQSALNWLEGA